MLLLAGCGNENGFQMETQTTETTVEQTVELTIPKNHVVEKYSDLYDVTINSDGSVTYHLTQAQYDTLLNDVREETENALQVIMKNIPTFTSIGHDEDFQKITVETSNDELSFREAASMLTLTAYGKIYNAYAGNPNAVIYITYNHDGKELYSCDSSG